MFFHSRRERPIANPTESAPPPVPLTRLLLWDAHFDLPNDRGSAEALDIHREHNAEAVGICSRWLGLGWTIPVTNGQTVQTQRADTELRCR